MDDPTRIAELEARLKALEADNDSLRRELRFARQDYLSFLRRAPLAISIVKNFNISFVNDKWLELFGYKDSEAVLGASSITFLSPEVRDATVAKLQGLGQSSSDVYHIETRALRQDGTSFDILLIITRMQVLQEEGYVSFILDTTRLRETERELSSSMALYRAIFNNLFAGIAIVERSGRFLQVNLQYATLFGYSPDELIGCDPLRLIHPEARKNTQGSLQRLFNGELPYYMHEKLFVRKDGSQFWGHVFVSPLADAEGAIQRAICLVIDVSERKEAEQALARLNRELEAKVHERTQDLEDKARALEQANATLQRLDDMKTAFVSSVSHELRTPLTSIFGFAKLIRRDFDRHCTPLASEQCELQKPFKRITSNLDIIEQEGQRLSRLVNDVLDLNKIESGRSQCNMQRTPLASSIYDALLAVSGLFSQKEQVILRSEVPPDLPEVYADPDQLVQVLINLLHNAAKFTVEGEVCIKASPRGSTTVLVAISDTGCGIPEQELHKVFDSFHQSHTGDTLKRPLEGTGLGLAISKQIIERHGGRIWVESTEDLGSSFFFELPLAANVSRET